MTTLITKACGKIMVAGEYAVLFGAPVLVLPSSQTASCMFTAQKEFSFTTHMDATKKDLRLYRSAKNIAERHGLDFHSGDYLLDTSAFFNPTSKLKYGLGSSAAATVALVKMLLLHNNVDDRDRLLAISLAVHKDLSGGLGSGADVATAVYGQAIKFVIGDPTPAITTITPSTFLAELMVVSTPRAQATKDFVRAVLHLHDRSQKFLDDFTAASRDLCERIVRAHVEKDFIAALNELSSWLSDLGEHAKIPIITDEHRAIMALAQSLGGAAKPSGAGGGDIAIAYVPAQNRAHFIDELAKIPGCAKL